MSLESYHFQIGTFRCISINDGYIANIPTRWFFANAPADQLEPVLRRYGLLSDTLATPCNCLVVDTGTHRVLLDTGGGKDHGPYGRSIPGTAPIQPALGGLMAGLKAEGIDPESIDTVILSHMHGDHVGGAADAAGKPFFPNARYVMARGEWNDMASIRIPDDDDEWDGWVPQVRFLQRKCLAVQDRVDLVEPEVEIVPGICIFPTPGHTGYHCSIEFASGSERLVCPMDTLGHPIHAEHPDWNAEGEQSLASRLRILKRAEAATLVHGYHYPFPGIGTMHADGETWRWRPG